MEEEVVGCGEKGGGRDEVGPEEPERFDLGESSRDEFLRRAK